MVHRQPWYERALNEKRVEIVRSALFFLIFTVSISFWYFFSGQSFEWTPISPIEAPSFPYRLLYSALVFVTLGASLYYLGFYKWLYSFFRGVRGGYRDYKELKRLIWTSLIMLMFFVIVPMVVKILNSVISFFYNVYVLILYVFPSLAISALIFGAGYYLYKYYGKNLIQR